MAGSIYSTSGILGFWRLLSAKKNCRRMDANITILPYFYYTSFGAIA
jgi:hypothetical protein